MSWEILSVVVGIVGAIAGVWSVYYAHVQTKLTKSVAQLGAGGATTHDVEPARATRSPYSFEVGLRLARLREATLAMSLREMTEFLGLESVTALESFESGRVEFPVAHIKKIESFFRVRPRYVERGEGSIFEPFTLSQESVSAFLQEGYTPILACGPDDRHGGYCYQLFERRTQGLAQIAMAERPGSFASSGGGKMNIGYLIRALLDAGRTPGDVRIVKATPAEWAAIEACEYYSKDPFARFGCADWDCMDTFDKWFVEYSDARSKTQSSQSVALDVKR